MDKNMSVFDTDVLDANNSSTNESSTNTIENVETGQSEAKKTNKKVNAKKLIASNTASTRILPVLVDELINHGFDVRVTKDGYAVGGFYGLNDDGFAVLKEVDFTESELDKNQYENALIAIDNKNKSHLISNFDDLIKFHLVIWKSYFKQKEYMVLNSKWYPFVINSPYISITPNI